MSKRKSHKPKNNNNKINKNKKKAQRKKKQKKDSKIFFRGLNGEKYDKDGNKQEISSDEDNDNIILYIENFFTKIKTSNKIIKAKEYLNNFKEDKNNWKFNKNNQIFILKYILYNEIFDNNYFKIFLDYIKNMFKETKEKFIKQCEDYINKYKDIKVDENNMEFNIGNHKLKFINIYNANNFYSNLIKRCVEIIENN
jgi:hypothetical protein